MHTVAYADIEKARTVFEWGPEPRPSKPKTKPAAKTEAVTRRPPPDPARAESKQPKPKKKKVNAIMSNPELMDALAALAADKGVSVDTLFGALADALESAYKRMPGAHEYAWVTIDPDSGEIRRHGPGARRGRRARRSASSTSRPRTSVASPRRRRAR